MDPKPTAKNVASSGNIDRPMQAAAQPRDVPLVVSLDWAQVLHRQQQLLNESESGVYLRIFRDEHGLVRIDLHE